MTTAQVLTKVTRYAIVHVHAGRITFLGRPIEPEEPSGELTYQQQMIFVKKVDAERGRDRWLELYGNGKDKISVADTRIVSFKVGL